MNVRYRILSFSSQNQSYPIGNLLSKHSPWQSERFCDYPQQITISFYQPMHITAIRIAAHPAKIPSRINILHHLPEHDDTGFTKYGFITFSQGNMNSSNPIEVKELVYVDIRALEMRFLILRNHMNKNNFFNQVAVSSLTFTATPIDHVIPNVVTNKSTTFSFEPQINIFNQLKNNFIKREQFQEAKQIKQILSLIERANVKINDFQQEKQKCIKVQDFMGAKRVKENLVNYKNEVTELVNNFYDPERKVLRTIKSDQRLRKKVEELNLLKNSSVFSQGSEPKTPKTSRLRQEPQILKHQMEIVSEGEHEQEELIDKNESMVSHEDRILPAVMSRIKGMNQTQIIPESSQIGDNQFFESSQKAPLLPAEPQGMTPADEANASLLLEFYDNLFIRKLHSKYWQFKLEAIHKVVEQIKQNQSQGPSFLTKNRLRCFLFIYSISLKSHNFQIANASLEFMNILAPMKPQGEFKGELHNELQGALKNTIKKLNDSNQKIKNMSQKTLLRIIQSSIFGVGLCYSSIIKSYQEKVSAKIRKIKLEDIEYMVQKYGVGENGVPLSVVDFALKAANDQDSDVRKSAINLAKSIKQHGGKQRLQSLLLESSGVRSSIAKQLSV